VIRKYNRHSPERLRRAGAFLLICNDYLMACCLNCFNICILLGMRKSTELWFILIYRVNMKEQYNRSK
jgi:hypothetical protein